LFFFWLLNSNGFFYSNSGGFLGTILKKNAFKINKKTRQSRITYVSSTIGSSSIFKEPNLTSKEEIAAEVLGNTTGSS
jgi:hypothetical protein